MTSRYWSESFRALGSAILSLLKAELEALEHDVTRSTKQAAIGLALLGAAAALGFWTLGVATYFLIQLLALWLPLWGASLAVALGFAVVVAVLALVGARKLEKWENPLGTARRRIDDHIDWWQNRAVVPERSRRVGSGEATDSTGTDDEAEVHP